MGVLKDSCVFIHGTVTSDKILDFSKDCQSIEKKLTISDEILKELRPGRRVTDQAVREKATARYETVKGAIKFNLIDMIVLKSNAEVLKNYKKIRKDFYDWMKNPQYIRRLIRKGLLTMDDVNNPGFEYTDVGECSLVAIAMTDTDKYIIVSNDKGEVCAHPHINIYENDIASNLNVMKYDEWQHFINTKLNRS